MRAVGPKQSPRNRSLVFVHPSQYKPSRTGRRRGVCVRVYIRECCVCVPALLHIWYKCIAFLCTMLYSTYSSHPSIPLTSLPPPPPPFFKSVHPTSAQSSAKSLSESSLCIQSVEWSKPLSPRKRGTQSPSDTAQYHSLVGDMHLGRHTRRSPRRKTKTPPPVKVLPMKVLDSPQHTPVITT